MATVTKITTGKFLTYGFAAVTEVAILAAFIAGWFSLAASWLLVVFAVVGCILTTLIIAMIVLAGESIDKAVETQLIAIGVLAITLCLLSGILLLRTVFKLI